MSSVLTHELLECRPTTASVCLMTRDALVPALVAYHRMLANHRTSVQEISVIVSGKLSRDDARPPRAATPSALPSHHVVLRNESSVGPLASGPLPSCRKSPRTLAPLRSLPGDLTLDRPHSSVPPPPSFLTHSRPSSAFRPLPSAHPVTLQPPHLSSPAPNLSPAHQRCVSFHPSMPPTNPAVCVVRAAQWWWLSFLAKKSS